MKLQEILVEKKWSGKVKTKWEAPEGLFTKPAPEIANVLAKASDGYAQAVHRLTFYINRAGKNLSADDKERLNKVKDLLAKHYEVKEEESFDTDWQLNEALWSGSVKTKWHPGEGFFKKSASAIASGLKKASKDLKQAMGRLNFYVNRAGRNLSADDKARLGQAKVLLRKAFMPVTEATVAKPSLYELIKAVLPPAAVAKFDSGIEQLERRGGRFMSNRNGPPPATDDEIDEWMLSYAEKYKIDTKPLLKRAGYKV